MQQQRWVGRRLSPAAPACVSVPSTCALIGSDQTRQSAMLDELHCNAWQSTRTAQRCNHLKMRICGAGVNVGASCGQHAAFVLWRHSMGGVAFRTCLPTKARM